MQTIDSTLVSVRPARPVTPEAAGSSPVDPANYSRGNEGVRCTGTDAITPRFIRISTSPCADDGHSHCLLCACWRHDCSQAFGRCDRINSWRCRRAASGYGPGSVDTHGCNAPRTCRCTHGDARDSNGRRSHWIDRGQTSGPIAASKYVFRNITVAFRGWSSLCSAAACHRRFANGRGPSSVAPEVMKTSLDDSWIRCLVGGPH